MSTTLFKRNNALAIRLWHWLTAVVIFCLLLKIFFGNAFLNSSRSSKIIFSELQKSGATILGVALLFGVCLIYSCTITCECIFFTTQQGCEFNWSSASKKI